MSSSPVHHEVLPNGLTVLLRPMHVAPVAEVQVWARVGSADEGPAEAGLAHFHEHMLFKGTARRGVGQVAGEVEGVGGRINAYTGFDVTVYHATLPGSALPAGIDVLADAVRHSTFEPDEITREIEVVLEEIRRAEDSPHSVLANALFAAVYRAHPYRAPILGSAASVASFDRDKVMRFFRTWYGPENLMVVAVGDLDVESVRAAIRAAFGDAEPGSGRRGRPAEPPQEGLRSALLRRAFERASLDLAFPTVPFQDPDAPLLDLLAFVLGEGESSRLVVRVKEEEGLCEHVEASSFTPLDRGLFGIQLDLDPARCSEALAAAVREAERLRHELVTAEELERARANFLAHEYFERESVSGVARKIGSFQAIGGDHRREKDYFDAIRAARPADLLRVARTYLVPERLTVAAVLPEGEGDLDAGLVARAVGAGIEGTRRRFAPPAVSRRGAEIVSYALASGAALHVLPRREVPVVAARAAFLGGQLAEDEATAGITGFLAGMWLRGTRARSNAELARAIESLAADIDGFAGRNSMGLTLDVPSDRLEPALDLFAEVLLAPAFDPEELERERRETLAALERREDRLGSRCFDLFTETHYRTHPYRLPLAGTEKSVRALSPESVAAHHARLVRGANAVLAVSGDVDPDAVAAGLAARLAELPAGSFERPAPPIEPPPREVRTGELRKDRAQAHLVLGFRGLAFDDPDREALEVITQILAGQGGRLFLELRDRRSLAYSVTAVNVEGVAPGFLAVYIATAPEKLEEARRGMFEELERVLEVPPKAEELERARRYLTGSFLIDEQRNGVRAAQVALDALYGLGPDHHGRYPERIAAVGTEDVLRVARRVIDLSAYTLAMIRPGSG